MSTNPEFEEVPFSFLKTGADLANTLLDGMDTSEQKRKYASRLLQVFKKYQRQLKKKLKGGI